jgi:hypothetical protein
MNVASQSPQTAPHPPAPTGARRSPRNPLPRAWRIPLACATVAIASACLAVLATVSIADWNVTVLVRMAAEEPMAPVARETDPDFVFVHYHGRGDGVSYYAIARDPLARGDEHDLIQWPAYRYGHPGYSWLARVIAFGSVSLLPVVLLLLNLIGMGVAGAAASLVARDLGYSAWGGLVVALNPGLVYATTIDTSEPVAAGFLAVVLLLWLRGRRVAALPMIAALCFMKEWFVLVPVGLALWELVQMLRRRRRDGWRRVAALVLSIVPFGLWYLYVLLRFDEWPASPTRDFLQLPPTGWIQTARTAAEMGVDSFDRLVTGHVAVPLLATLAVAFLIGIVRGFRLRTPIDPVYLMFMPIVFAMNTWGLLYAKDAIREVAIPLLLLPGVLAGRRIAQSGSSPPPEPGVDDSPAVPG